MLRSGKFRLRIDCETKFNRAQHATLFGSVLEVIRTRNLPGCSMQPPLDVFPRGGGSAQPPENGEFQPGTEVGSPYRNYFA